MLNLLAFVSNDEDANLNMKSLETSSQTCEEIHQNLSGFHTAIRCSASSPYLTNSCVHRYACVGIL